MALDRAYRQQVERPRRAHVVGLRPPARSKRGEIGRDLACRLCGRQTRCRNERRGHPGRRRCCGERVQCWQWLRQWRGRGVDQPSSSPGAPPPFPPMPRRCTRCSERQCLRIRTPVAPPFGPVDVLPTVSCRTRGIARPPACHSKSGLDTGLSLVGRPLMGLDEIPRSRRAPMRSPARRDRDGRIPARTRKSVPRRQSECGRSVRSRCRSHRRHRSPLRRS